MATNDDLALPSLMEAWRSPSGGKRVLKGSSLRLSAGQGRGAVTGSARERLSRIVRKAPEVMVKVSGRQRGAGHVAAHLGYIGRQGKLEVETGDGERITSIEGLRALALDWQSLDDATNRGRSRPTSISMVLSMPAGIDAELVYDAARAFARVELGECFSYAMALHTDTDHPHVHVTVAAEGLNGTRFNPRKADLHAFRERFAHELRSRGVECEATPRRARGVVRKADASAVRHIALRWERRAPGRAGEVVRTYQRIREDAVGIARSGSSDARGQDDEALRRQRSVRGAYEAAAQALEQSGDPADHVLGQAVRDFVEAMPLPLSRALIMAVEIGRRDRAVAEGGEGARRNEPLQSPSPPERAPAPRKGPDRGR